MVSLTTDEEMLLAILDSDVLFEDHFVTTRPWTIFSGFIFSGWLPTVKTMNLPSHENFSAYCSEHFLLVLYLFLCCFPVWLDCCAFCCLQWTLECLTGIVGYLPLWSQCERKGNLKVCMADSVSTSWRQHLVLLCTVGTFRWVKFHKISKYPSTCENFDWFY